MKVLITGGAGALGSGLAKGFLDRDFDVTVLDIIRKDEAWRLLDFMSKIKYEWKSVQDITRKNIKGYDIVVNACAQPDRPLGLTSPRLTFYQNIQSTINILECCRKTDIDLFIYPGSGTILIGNSQIPTTEKALPKPLNPYSASKYSAEVLTQMYYRCYGIPTISLRSGIVYGPRMRTDMSIFQFLYKAIKGKNIVVRSPETTRTPAYLDDVVEGWFEVINNKEKLIGKVLHIVGDEEFKMIEVAKKASKVMGSKNQIIRGEYEPGEKINGEPVRECISNEKAKEILDWKPKTSLKQGLQKTGIWIKENLEKWRV